MTYSNVFTGETIHASQSSITKLDLTANVTLYWPREAEPNVDVVSGIVEISTANADNYVITMPDARIGSTGETVIFNNATARPVIIDDSTGTQIVVVAANTQYVVYLRTNATQAGTWFSCQLGASSAAADAGALAGYGLKAISTTLNTKIDTTAFQYSFTLAATDRAQFYSWVGTAGGVVVTLPVGATVGEDWYCLVRNNGTDSITIDPQGTNEINGGSNLTMQPSDSAIIACDGTDFYTIGLGRSVAFAFDYVVIDVSGAVNYTLSGAELNRVAYKFTGTITANVKVIVPATVQQYWVNHQVTVGAFTLYLATAAQVTPITLTATQKSLFYCDGTNVIPAITATYSGEVDGGSF